MRTNATTLLFAGLLTATAGGVPNSAARQMTSPFGHYARVGDLDMYYEARGSGGEPLVLIHGGGSTIGTSFGRIMPLLAEHMRVIAVELQGHGHTSDRNAPESFERDADDVAALLKELKVTKASFLGFSNGGNTAMQVAVRHPQIVGKLVLASTFYKREGLIPGFFEGMQQATLDDMPGVLKDAFLAINPDQAKLKTMFNKDRERMLRFIDWKDDTLKSIRVPTLIINGDRDVIVTSHAVAMSRLIANSRLLVVPATHGAYLGAAEAGPADDLVPFTTKIVTAFLRQH